MSKMILSVSPHIRSTRTTQNIMLDVIIALVPALIASVVLYGIRALLLTLNVEAGSVVTSGDYQRYFVVDGVRYCHIIDPQTLFPATRYSGVTIFGPDSGQADALSTALFLLPQEEGEGLLPEGYGALWADPEENLTATPLFRSAVREAGLLP